MESLKYKTCREILQTLSYSELESLQRDIVKISIPRLENALEVLTKIVDIPEYKVVHFWNPYDNPEAIISHPKIVEDDRWLTGAMHVDARYYLCLVLVANTGISSVRIWRSDVIVCENETEMEKQVGYIDWQGQWYEESISYLGSWKNKKLLRETYIPFASLCDRLDQLWEIYCSALNQGVIQQEYHTTHL